MITLKHKDNLSIPFPPTLYETWEGIKGVEVKTGIRIYNSCPCSLTFCTFVLFLSRNWSDYKSERIEVSIWGIVLKLLLWTQSVIWTPNVIKLGFVKSSHQFTMDLFENVLTNTAFRPVHTSIYLGKYCR